MSIQGAVYLKAKTPDETLPITWVIEIPVVSARVSATVELGVDPSPETTLAFGPLTYEGEVVQYVTGGLDGVTYRIELLADLIDNSTISVVSYLPVKETP